jgi:hypothetical protein
MCIGQACAACDAAGEPRDSSAVGRCKHDEVERHRAMIAIPKDIDLLRQDRTPTRPVPKLLAKKFTIGIEHPHRIVEVLKTMIEIFEKHGEITITVEAPAAEPTDE